MTTNTKFSYNHVKTFLIMSIFLTLFLITPLHILCLHSKYSPGIPPSQYVPFQVFSHKQILSIPSLIADSNVNSSMDLSLFYYRENNFFFCDTITFHLVLWLFKYIH